MTPAARLAVVLCVAWLTPTQCLAAQPSAAPAADAADDAIICRSIGLDPPRTWTFTRHDATWRVTHQEEGLTRRATLVLPSPAVTQTGTTVHIRARTANGGIDITLDGPWGRATLDAYVNYELEVNVDVSLTPDIDAIATEAPTGVACTRRS